MQEPLPIVVLISGNGSNLQAIIDAMDHGLNIELRAVISNEPNAFGITRAKRSGIPAHIICHRDFSSRPDFEAALIDQIDMYNPSLIVLAGFMRSLTADFVDLFYGHVINIHPSLLPKYPGLRTHQRVLEAGDERHGASIHYVTAQVDGGPIICQASLPVLPDDTIDSLAQRVQKMEHLMYPQVLDWIAADRLRLINDKPVLDGKPAPEQGFPLDHITDKQ